MKKITDFTKYLNSRTIAPSLVALAFGAGLGIVGWANKPSTPKVVEQDKTTVALDDVTETSQEKELRELDAQIVALAEQIRNTPESDYARRVNLDLEMFEKYSRLLILNGSASAHDARLSKIITSLDDVINKWSSELTAEELDTFYTVYYNVEDGTGLVNEPAKQKIYQLGETRRYTLAFKERLTNHNWNAALDVARTLVGFSGEDLETYVNKIDSHKLSFAAEKDFAFWLANKDSDKPDERRNAELALDKSYKLIVDAFDLDTSRRAELEDLIESIRVAERPVRLAEYEQKLNALYEGIPVKIFSGKQIDVNAEVDALWKEFRAERDELLFTDVEENHFAEEQGKAIYNSLRRPFQEEAEKANEQLYKFRAKSVPKHDLLSILTQPEGWELYQLVSQDMFEEGVLDETYTVEDVVAVLSEEVLERMNSNNTSEARRLKGQLFVANGLSNWKAHKRYTDKLNSENEDEVRFARENLTMIKNVHEYVSNVSDLQKGLANQARMRIKIVEQFGETTANQLDKFSNAHYSNPLQTNYVNTKEWNRVLLERVINFEKSCTGRNQRAVYEQLMGEQTLAQVIEEHRANEAVKKDDERVRIVQIEQILAHQTAGGVYRAGEHVVQAVGDLGQALIYLLRSPVTVFKNGTRDFKKLGNEFVSAGSNVVGAVDDALGLGRTAKGIILHPLEGLPYLGNTVSAINDATPLQDPFSTRDNSYDNGSVFGGLTHGYKGPRNGPVDAYKRDKEEYGTFGAIQRAVIRGMTDAFVVKQAYDALTPESSTGKAQNNTGTSEPTPNPTPGPTPTPGPSPTPNPTPGGSSGGLTGGHVGGPVIKVNN